MASGVAGAVHRAFKGLRESGRGSANIPANGDDRWFSEVAVPFWRACAARADKAGLPVCCDYGFIMFEDNVDDVEASVYLLHPWTRVSSDYFGCGEYGQREDEWAIDAWERHRSAGPPPGVSPPPEAVEDAYRALTADGVVTGPVFRWEGWLRRRRRREWWRQVAGPWLAVLVARADADGRPVAADCWSSPVVGCGLGLSEEWRPRLRLLDPQTRTPLGGP